MARKKHKHGVTEVVHKHHIKIKHPMVAHHETKKKGHGHRHRRRRKMAW